MIAERSSLETEGAGLPKSQNVIPGNRLTYARCKLYRLITVNNFSNHF